MNYFKYYNNSIIIKELDTDPDPLEKTVFFCNTFFNSNDTNLYNNTDIIVDKEQGFFFNTCYHSTDMFLIVFDILINHNKTTAVLNLNNPNTTIANVAKYYINNNIISDNSITI